MYVRKVKIFENSVNAVLELMVNEFLEKENELGFTVLGVQYQVSANNNKSCLVYYTQEAKE